MMHVIIATHDTLASGLVSTAKMICGSIPKTCHCVELDEQGIEVFSEKMETLRQKIGEDSVIVLCDLRGATPFNVAIRHFNDKNHAVIAGVNLPMVLTALSNFENEPIETFAASIVKISQESILSNLELLVPDDDDIFA